MREGSEMMANDIIQEGLITLIVLIRFWERVTSLVTDIVFLSKPCLVGGRDVGFGFGVYRTTSLLLMTTTGSRKE
jgi:hypothetical protein